VYNPASILFLLVVAALGGVVFLGLVGVAVFRLYSAPCMYWFWPFGLIAIAFVRLAPVRH
jgi:hypothetical protein